MEKKAVNNSSLGNKTNISVSWGRGASEYRPGIFIKQYFVEHTEACAADIYRALVEEIERMNKFRVETSEQPLRRPNYNSFNRYMHWFTILRLIKRTGKTEPAIYNFLKNRVYYRLTDKGKTEVIAWNDPVSAAHPELR